MCLLGWNKRQSPRLYNISKLSSKVKRRRCIQCACIDPITQIDHGEYFIDASLGASWSGWGWGWGPKEVKMNSQGRIQDF